MEMGGSTHACGKCRMLVYELYCGNNDEKQFINEKSKYYENIKK